MKVPTRSTWLHIPADGFLQSHRLENLNLKLFNLSFVTDIIPCDYSIFGLFPSFGISNSANKTGNVPILR
jgi:hypothetical protein